MSGIAAIDNDFPEHRKVQGLHDRAFRFHVTALCYCSRNLTDGHVNGRAVKVIAAILETTSKRWAGDLVKVGLWKRDEKGDGFWINDYLKHNPSSASLKKLRDRRREAGIKGAEKRWGVGNGESNGDSSSDGKSHTEPHVPAEQSRAGPRGSKSSGRKFTREAPDDPNGLPVENELLCARLMQSIGDHADANGGTRVVVRSYVAKLPPASFAKVIESIDLHHPKILDRAAYAVGALKDELERQAA